MATATDGPCEEANHRRPGRFLALARARLDALDPGWRLGGPGLVGNDGLGLRVVDHAPGSEQVSLDVTFLLDRDDERAGVIHDTVVAISDDPRLGVESAVEYWFRTTAPVIFELFNQHGEWADHYRGSEDGGLPGWHVIHGPIQGWGKDEHPELLQQWTVEHPLLPQLAPQLLPQLQHGELLSIRIFFGGDGTDDVAEVQINGDIDGEPAPPSSHCRGRAHVVSAASRSSCSPSIPSTTTDDRRCRRSGEDQIPVSVRRRVISPASLA